MYTDNDDENKTSSCWSWEMWLILGLASLIIGLIVFWLVMNHKRSCHTRSSANSGRTTVVVLRPKVVKSASSSIKSPVVSTIRLPTPVVNNVQELVDGNWDTINSALRTF